MPDTPEFSDFMIPTVAGLVWNARDAAGETVSPARYIAFGYGDYTPSGTETSLRSEVHRADIGHQGVYDDGPHAFFQTVVPVGVGGFQIREHGLLAEDGTLLAIGRRSPPVPKSTNDSFYWEIVVAFGYLDNITVLINENIGLPWATQADMDARAQLKIVDPKLYYDNLESYFCAHLAPIVTALAHQQVRQLDLQESRRQIVEFGS